MKVRWGLLSTARINRRLIPAIRADQRGELVAVASRDEARARAYAAEYNIPQAFGSYAAMLDSGEIDAAYIGLPNHLHAEWSIHALEAGVNVLCEKPFAITLDEVDAMIAASRRTGKVLAEAFMYRHHPQTKLVGNWIKEGKLGEVTLVQGTFSFFMNDRETNVRLVPEYGGGALWDVGIYPLSFAQYIFGRTPAAVSAVQWVGPSGIDESFAGQMDYGGAQTAQIACSFRNPFMASVVIHGTLGRLEINRPFLNMNEKGHQLLFTAVDGSSQRISVPRLDPYLGEVEDMHGAILDGQPNLIRLEESLHHIKTACALYAYAQNNQRIRLE